ncbi:MAG: hypothetical protein J5678_03810 [Bacteroidaceae bacterium]|nr:hypothetical protein [Bacteroidaceae bacterium]
MKKTYIIPQLTSTRIHVRPILTPSGGNPGNEGDNAESIKFWGSSLFDDEPEEEPIDNDIL